LAPNLFAVSLASESSFTRKESLPDFIETISTDNAKPSNEALAASICDIGNTCASPSVIDLMVVYTQLAETNWGGSSNTVANITQAVTNMNISMTNSGINNVTFRLVHTAKMSYTESGNFGTDLSRLAGTSDGYMDNVHSIWCRYGQPDHWVTNKQLRYWLFKYFYYKLFSKQRIQCLFIFLRGGKLYNGS
jgi:peptidyl-Asp metalloendopeptidase